VGHQRAFAGTVCHERLLVAGTCPGLQIQWLLSHSRLDMAGILRAHLQAQLTVPLAVGRSAGARWVSPP
jgi:hypothetical protein